MASSKKPAASNKPAADLTPPVPATAPAAPAHPLRRATDTPNDDAQGNTTGPSPLPTADTPTPNGSGNGTGAKEGAKVPDIAGEIKGSVLTLTFKDGRKLTLDGEKLPREIQIAAMMHGLKQKTVDAAAIARDTTTGRSASLQDKFDAVEEIVNRLTGENPTWNKIREGGTAAPGSNLLVRALMELSGKDRAQTLAFLEAKSKEQVAALRKNEKVATIIARLQAEAAKADKSGAGVDSDAVLGEFMGDAKPEGAEQDAE